LNKNFIKYKRSSSIYRYRSCKKTTSKTFFRELQTSKPKVISISISHDDSGCSQDGMNLSLYHFVKIVYKENIKTSLQRIQVFLIVFVPLQELHQASAKVVVQFYVNDLTFHTSSSDLNHLVLLFALYIYFHFY